VPEIITQLCSDDALDLDLSFEIREILATGGTVPDAAIIAALRHRLASPDVLTRGWVMDDFPLTEQQAQALTAAGIVPHRLLVVHAQEADIFQRAKGGADLVQREAALQRKRVDAYMASAPLLRAYYGLTFSSVIDLPAASEWAVCDQALQETSTAISTRLEYYRRTSQGMAARVHGMCFPPSRLLTGESDWKHYCPVTLTLTNELVLAKDSSCVVEYRGSIYWLATAEKAKLFLDNPESFLKVPLPTQLPTLLSAIERRGKPAMQLEDYCPVALVDRKELVKASGNHIVRYHSKNYGFESKQASEKFMRRPMRYVQRAALPSKRAALKGENTVALLAALTKGRDGRGIEPADMLTFMQASVAEIICQAMVESGERRPLYPGKTPQESALLFLSRFLQAKNPLSTEMRAEGQRKQYQEFLEGVALPTHFKEESERKEGEGTWTTSDSRHFKELCGRFDEVFKLPSS